MENENRAILVRALLVLAALLICTVAQYYANKLDAYRDCTRTTEEVYLETVQRIAEVGNGIEPSEAQQRLKLAKETYEIMWEMCDAEYYSN